MGKKEEQEDNHRSPSSHHNQKLECFVGHSHKAPWRDDIISACEETLPKFGLQPWYADDQFEPTKSLRDKVVEMVANARYGIYDLSWWRPDEQSPWKMPQNVLIELGMAIALNRPALLLRHAENRASGLPLPTCLDSISQRIVEFSGGPTLKHALEERLPQWLDVPPERAWWARYCLFGERTCTYRETYPQIIQCGQKTIGCHIADGKDIDRPDFRSLIEDELGRYSDISFDYLDALLSTAGYDFQLCTYCQIVRSTPFAIYRITPETTAEAFIAIGMSIALEKQFKCEIPKFIFTTDARSIPSLLFGYEVVETKNTKDRQKHLRRSIPVVMRKVRESMWKPKSLPFVEDLPLSTEISLSKKNQALFSESDEEKALSNSEEDIDNMETSHQFCEKCGAANRATSRFCRYCGNLLIFKPNDRLRAARENKHISREQVATQIGTSKLNIGRWERGDASPHSSFIEKLCELFEKTEEELGLKYYNDVEEQGYCESVIKQLTPRQLEVLQAFARGLHPSGVADLLSISAPTVSTHTTVLLGLCRNTWSIEARNRLDYRFLQHKFGRYLQNYDAGEIVKASDGDEDRVL